MLQSIMALLKGGVVMLASYSFQQSITPEIEELFSGCEELGDELDYTVEIIEAALSGKIDLNRPFNIVSYVRAVKKHERLEGERRAKKLLHIQPSNPDDDTLEPYSIKEENIQIVVEEKSDFDKLEDSFELQEAVDFINGMESELVVTENIFIVKVIRQALKGIPDSVKILKDICTYYSDVAEAIKIILQSGESFEELFPER